ncbi:MAG: phospholipid-binding protein [Gammaproteobacteria bacterium]|nr:MAG: phospholipid-binding protein [Gammaproteobacteria bacterium]RLA47886.1 MAG: phospholipid-binding protein [Gammaproteobacteria bacterium]
MTKIVFGLLLLGIVATAGCTSTINAVTSEPIKPDPGETSIGTDLDDWRMATSIGVNIKKAHPSLANSHINVHAFNKLILLTGEVPSKQMRALAGKTAREFHGVRQVYNELDIQGATSLLSRTNDSWLTAKVKSKLIANSKIDSGEVDVITENGVIYLMGLVSRRDADTITAIASNTGGARKVVRVFEYLD